MAATETETTIGTKKIFPVITIVPANNGADYDLEGVGADIDALATAVEAVSGAICLGVSTKYKLNNEGFEINPVEGTLDNRKNPHLTYEAKGVVPAPDGAGSTIQAKIDALVAIQTAGLYDVYMYDPETQADGWVAKMLNVKVKALETITPDGMMYMVTITSQNYGDVEYKWLAQSAP